jgi:hypothetical protein
MNDKGANIDLLFRNGLKDYEVLPPAGVWDGITASGRVKSRPLIFFRVAAAAAVLLSIGLFTYTYTSEIKHEANNAVIAFNMVAPTPVTLDKPVRHKSSVIVASAQKEIISEVAAPDTEESLNEPVDEMVSLPSQVFNFKSNRSLHLSGNTKRNDILRQDQQNAAIGQLNYTDFQFKPDEKAKPADKWSIMAMASPTYYSRFNTGSDYMVDQMLSSEAPIVSYSGGLGFSYKLSKRLSVQSGLYYSALGQRVEGINSYAGFKQYDNSKGGYNFEVLTSSGTVTASNPDVFLNADASERVITAYTKDVFDPRKASLQYINNSLTQSFSYLELPVTLKYKVVDKTIGINLIGGMSYNLLVHNSVYTDIDGSKYLIGDTKGMNTLSLSSTLGMGMEYNLSGNLSLNLEPMFRYYLNPFSQSGSFIHPYSFGIFSGVSFKF